MDYRRELIEAVHDLVDAGWDVAIARREGGAKADMYAAETAALVFKRCQILMEMARGRAWELRQYGLKERLHILEARVAMLAQMSQMYAISVGTGDTRGAETTGATIQRNADSLCDSLADLPPLPDRQAQRCCTGCEYCEALHMVRCPLADEASRQEAGKPPQDAESERTSRAPRRVSQPSTGGPRESDSEKATEASASTPAARQPRPAPQLRTQLFRSLGNSEADSQRCAAPNPHSLVTGEAGSAPLARGATGAAHPLSDEHEPVEGWGRAVGNA